MSATDITFKGFNINDGSVYITSELDDTAPWERNVTIYNLARKNGAVLTDDEYTTKPITVTGRIQGSNAADLEAKIDAFMTAMAVGVQNLDIGWAGSTRRYSCYPSSYSAPRPVRAGSWANFNITFTALDYGTATAASHYVTSTAITSPHDFTFDVGGSAPDQWLQMTITITAATLSSTNTLKVSNPTTGETMSLTRAYTVGEVVTIDTLLEEVRVNGVLKDYDGAFPSYTPGAAQTLHVEADFQTVGTTTLTSSGTWTAPANVVSAFVELWGGGGGGGGAATTGGAGGGAGGYYAASNLTVVPATGYAVAIGAGGTAGTSAGTAGGSGGNTTFASTVVIAAGNGGGGAAANGAAGSGSHPNASVGQTIFAGGSGSLPQSGTGSGSGAGGGGESGGPSGTGHTANAGNSSVGGSGGTGFADAGDGGAGGGAGAAGTAGTVPGGGGGGASKSTTNRAGGAGAGGQFRVTYPIPAYTLTVVVDSTKKYL
jgi:hypothetical protein